MSDARAGTVPSLFLVIVPLSLFFGWLLVFPFHGPLLNAYALERGGDPGELGLIFVAAHGVGFLAAGSFAERHRAWRRMMLGGGGLSFLLCVALPGAAPGMLPVLFALCGAASALFVIGWSVPYSALIPSGRRIATMALIIGAANLIYIAVKSAVTLLPVWPAFAASLAALAGALLSVLCVRMPRRHASGSAALPEAVIASGCRTGYRRYGSGVPAVLMLALCVLVFFLYINGGFMYLVLHPSAPESMVWLPVFRDIVYLSVLIICAAVGSRIDRMLPVYAAASLIGLAFVAYALFDAYRIGRLAAEALSQTSVALLDLFLWTILGDIASLYRRPFRVFGWGLAANVFGIFLGGIIGIRVVLQIRSPELVVSAFTATTVSFTFLLFPLLASRIGSDLVERIRSFGELAEERDKEASAVAGSERRIRYLRSRLPDFDSLTPRETEIALELIEGRNNREIAARLFISENTLKVHLRHIFRKMDVSNRSEFLSLVLSVYEDEPVQRPPDREDGSGGPESPRWSVPGGASGRRP